MTVILDYDMGNVCSIQNMLKKLGERAEISRDPERIRRADRLILPGVGNFDAGMAGLETFGLADLLRRQALEEKKPVLGICLGMQLLGLGSEEGERPGLGLIPFRSVRFRPAEGSGLKVPHMGWDTVSVTRECPLTAELPRGERYYFVHSYYGVCDDPAAHQIMACDYGVTFAAAVGRDNVYGVQFHPEKSHRFGMALLKNFAEVC